MITLEQVEDPVARYLLAKNRPDPLGEALAADPAGLQPEQVARAVGDTSPAVAAKRAEVAAAGHRLDQAYAAYFPRLSATASYTRQSPVENSFDIGIEVPGVEIPSFPVVNNLYMLTASVEVPLSDYLLRLTSGFAAASLDQESKDLAARAQRLQVEGDARIAYYNWVRAKGRGVVARLSTIRAEIHVNDARTTLAAGLITAADVLRLEAELAQARHVAALSEALVARNEEQLRLIMHQTDIPLTIGVDVFEQRKPDARALADLQRLAVRNRLELVALDKSGAALGEVAAATRATYWPRVAGFGSALYGNPNPRIFPQEDKWDMTWEVGLRMTWTVNDTFETIGRSREVEAQIAQLSAERRVLEDAIRMSVVHAYYDREIARSAIAAAQARLQAGEASLEARRKLFLGGKASSTDMVDAASELTAARVQRLDAHVDLLIAEARLDHTLGVAATTRAP